MKFIDWFAGIGGFRHGMELAGHECIGHCEFDKFAEASYRAMHTATAEQLKHLANLPKHKRQKEILKDEYLNGEWYASDIRAIRASDMPVTDCWTFGAPCQDFSIAGRRAGLEGERSSLVREIFRLLEETEEEDKPTWLIYENVKGMLSINRGLDYLSILAELDRLGYDAEWQNINSRWFVPQSRERIYTVGHLRTRGGRKILPITRDGGENNIKLIAGIYGKDGRLKNQYRTYCTDGIAPCLNTAEGGGREPYVCFAVDKSRNSPRKIDIANCISARGDRGVSNRKAEGTAVAIAIPVTRQNGRRCKGNGEDMFTLTAQDQHGVVSDTDIISKAVWSDKYSCYLVIRKLTPKECFRLQGWTDDCFSKAEFVNSDSQLYKQAGNGVTVSVIRAISERL